MERVECSLPRIVRRKRHGIVLYLSFAAWSLGALGLVVVRCRRYSRGRAMVCSRRSTKFAALAAVGREAMAGLFRRTNVSLSRRLDCGDPGRDSVFAIET